MIRHRMLAAACASAFVVLSLAHDTAAAGAATACASVPPFNAAKAKGVAVFFVTGRRDTDAQRQATIKNLTAAGYQGWAGLSLRPLSDHEPSVIPYKSGERAKIAAQGYTIIANVGDQQSDLAGGYADRAYKVHDPFYFIP